MGIHNKISNYFSLQCMYF